MQLRPTQLYASPLASYWKPRVTLMVTPAKVETVQPHEHKAKLSHEVISGAVAYEVWPRLFYYRLITDGYTSGSKSIRRPLQEAR